MEEIKAKGKESLCPFYNCFEKSNCRCKLVPEAIVLCRSDIKQCKFPREWSEIARCVDNLRCDPRTNSYEVAFAASGNTLKSDRGIIFKLGDKKHYRILIESADDEL